MRRLGGLSYDYEGTTLTFPCNLAYDANGNFQGAAVKTSEGGFGGKIDTILRAQYSVWLVAAILDSGAGELELTQCPWVCPAVRYVASLGSEKEHHDRRDHQPELPRTFHRNKQTCTDHHRM